MFVAAYLRALMFLAGRGRASQEAADRQVKFLSALSAEAKARLDRGEYPPFHLVNAARGVAGVPVETAKNWLLAFLYWRSHSLQIGSSTGAASDAEPGSATVGGCDLGS